MAGQDGVAPAEKQIKENVGRTKIKRKQENSDNPDADVPKSGSPRKQRRKRGDIAEKTEDQNAEDVFIKMEPDKNHSIVDVVPKLGPSKRQRRKKEETEETTEGQNAEEESVIKKPDKKLQKMQRRKENETVTENTECLSIKREGSTYHFIEDVVPKLGPSKRQRRKKEETEQKTEGQNAEEESVIKKPDKKLQNMQRRKKNETVTENTECLSIKEEAGTSNGAKISKRKKNETTISKSEKTKKVEESIEATDLIPRRLQLCSTSKKYVGAHVSIQGGLWNAALEAGRIGAKAFGLFLRSQRMWSGKPLEKSAAEKFRGTCKEFGFDARFILPHSPYIMNLGSPKPDVRQKSRDMLVDELNRCHQLGLTLYNIHPGSHLGEMPVNKCLELIADGINNAHSQVPDITVVLENMSCQGSTVGGRFEELRGIIDLVKDKTRIGVCLDTCHAFAAGHNLSEEKGLKHMLDEFDKVVGLLYLRAVHLNDSKGKVGCRLDRHENIGRGHIGVKGFRQVMNEPRFNEIPMILETPYTADFDEIELLYSLCVEGAITKLNTKKPSSTIGPI